VSTSYGEIAEGRTLFDCPVCGVHHDGPLRIRTEADTMDVEIGPWQTIPEFVRQTMTTSACGDVFVLRSITDEPTFDVTLTTRDGSPSLLRVSRR
jgi:hypothetical protein